MVTPNLPDEWAMLDPALITFLSSLSSGIAQLESRERARLFLSTQQALEAVEARGGLATEQIAVAQTLLQTVIDHSDAYRDLPSRL